MMMRKIIIRFIFNVVNLRRVKSILFNKISSLIIQRGYEDIWFNI